MTTVRKNDHIFPDTHLDRREFLSRSAALGLTAGLASSTLIKSSFAEEPRKGGTVKIGFEGGASGDSLDPAIYVANYHMVLAYSWGNGLVEVTPDGGLVSELAESWEPSADAKKWVFKIRKGVEFHNGKTLSAADVANSINYHRQEGSKSGAFGTLQGMSDVTVSADNEITIALSSANADLPYLLTDYHLIVMPDGDPSNAGVGTGPYILEAFEPGIRFIGKRNPNYWKEGRAHADSVELLVLNDPTARMNALQSGAVHFVNRVDPKVIPSLEQGGGVSAIPVATAAHYLFAMRTDIAPTNNKDLRLALKYAIDREDILKKILRGYGKVGNDSPVAPVHPFYAADLPQHAYDPDKAKFYFEKSGHGQPVQLFTANVAFSGAIDAAVLYQQHAAKAGIQLDVQKAPDDGYFSDVWLKKPFCATYWTSRPTADMILTVAYSSDASWNETYWKRPQFDKLLVEARSELDNQKRAQMYREMQLMISDDGGSLIFAFADDIFASRAEAKGFVPTPAQTGFHAAEQLYLTT